MDKVICECGSSISSKNISAHIKTKKHTEAMNGATTSVLIKKGKKKQEPANEADVVSNMERKGMLVSGPGIQEQLEALNENVADLAEFVDECYQSLFTLLCKVGNVEEDEIEDVEEECEDEKEVPEDEKTQ